MLAFPTYLMGAGFKLSGCTFLGINYYYYIGKVGTGHKMMDPGSARYSVLRFSLHNKIRSAAFDVTTCQSNLAEQGPTG